jgi:hypothetical protein
MHTPCILKNEEPSDITVTLRYLKGTFREHENYMFDGYDKLDLIGYRTYLGKDRVDWNRIWELIGLKISFRNEQGKHYINAVFHELRDKNYAFYLIKRLIRREYFRNRRKDYFNQLIEYTIYHPISWFLEEQKRMHLMHASAVEVGGKGILLPGLSGAGKSTISAYLFSAYNGKFLSDNLIFHDEEKIYSFFEPILLTRFSRALLPLGGDRIIFTDQDSPYKRKAALIETKSLIYETTPHMLFILKFSNKTFIRRISPKTAQAKIMDCGVLTGEIKRYFIYSSMMNLVSNNRILALDRIRSMETLLAKLDCFEVGIRQGDHLKQQIDETIAQLL